MQHQLKKKEILKLNTKKITYILKRIKIKILNFWVFEEN